MEVELMVTKRDDDDDDRVNIEQSASGRWNGRVLQYVPNSQINAMLIMVQGSGR